MVRMFHDQAETLPSSVSDTAYEGTESKFVQVFPIKPDTFLNETGWGRIFGIWGFYFSTRPCRILRHMPHLSGISLQALLSYLLNYRVYYVQSTGFLFFYIIILVGTWLLWTQSVVVQNRFKLLNLLNTLYLKCPIDIFSRLSCWLLLFPFTSLGLEEWVYCTVDLVVINQ